jgi:hypothetical protein
LKFQFSACIAKKVFLFVAKKYGMNQIVFSHGCHGCNRRMQRMLFLLDMQRGSIAHNLPGFKRMSIIGGSNVDCDMSQRVLVGIKKEGMDRCRQRVSMN